MHASAEEIASFVPILKEWFEKRRRLLPWRNNPSPYAVWVSEVMLQQTQVAVVIPYFERWMKRFPTVASLAESSLDEVIKLWEGLGYYARARNLYAGAKQVAEQFGGHLPNDPALLKNIKGLGPYTVGAIRAFAFHEKSAAVDGNVMRFLSRFFAIEEDISKAKTQKKVITLAEGLLPTKEPWITAEALIEFGATVCKKVPICSECPLQNRCSGFQKGLTKTLPLKRSRIAITPLYRTVPIMMHKNKILIRQVQEGEIMEGLHEFPYIETDVEGLELELLVEEIRRLFNLPAVPIQKFSPVSQSFTRYQVKLFPILLTTMSKKAPQGYFWSSLEEANALPFSSGHRKILNKLLR